MPQVIITEVRNAQSLNAENTLFDVEINHPEFGWIPYGLNPDDTDNTVDNSVLLTLIGSDYAAYLAPTQAEIDDGNALGVRTLRDSILTELVDPIVTNPMRWNDLTEAKQADWTQFRTDLLNIPSQEGFPSGEIVWPTKPT